MSKLGLILGAVIVAIVAAFLLVKRTTATTPAPEPIAVVEDPEPVYTIQPITIRAPVADEVVTPVYVGAPVIAPPDPPMSTTTATAILSAPINTFTDPVGAPLGTAATLLTNAFITLNPPPAAPQFQAVSGNAPLSVSDIWAAANPGGRVQIYDLSATAPGYYRVTIYGDNFTVPTGWSGTLNRDIYGTVSSGPYGNYQSGDFKGVV
jgi:hypothetical protein